MVSWENQQSIHFFDGKVNLRFRKATERDFIYASNEPKSVLARDLGDCRDNERQRVYARNECPCMHEIWETVAIT